MNNPIYPYGNLSGYGYQSYGATQPTTNKIYVTSLEDAMARYAGPNSTMIYVLQDESTVFEIYTDLQGRISAWRQICCIQTFARLFER